MEELINRKINQFLVHSFLYYKLDTSLISDHDYDKLCSDLFNIKNECKHHQNYNLIQQLDESGSGFYIKNYPLNVVTTSLRLLYNKIQPRESFSQFIGRYGYKLINKEELK